MSASTSKIEKMIDDLNANWRCRFGLIHSNPVDATKDPSTLNGQLYTGIVCAMIENAIRSCQIERSEKIDNFLFSCETAVNRCVQEGKYPMISRTPTNTDQQGPDDYKGYIAFMSLRKRYHILDDLLKYGAKSSMKLVWYLPKLGRWLNNTQDIGRKFDKIPDKDNTFLNRLKYWPVAPWGYKPWLSPWMGRFPAITWQLEVGSGSVGSFWKALWTAGSLGFTIVFSLTKPDSWYMDWCTIVTNDNALEPSKMVSWITKKWWIKLYETYPDGMKGVWAKYTAQHSIKFPLAEVFFE